MVNGEKREILLGVNNIGREIAINIEEDSNILVNHFNNYYKEELIHYLISQILSETGNHLTIVGKLENKEMNKSINRMYEVEYKETVEEVIEEGLEDSRLYYLTENSFKGKLEDEQIEGLYRNKEIIVITEVNGSKGLTRSFRDKQGVMIQMQTEETKQRDVMRLFRIPLPIIQTEKEVYVKRTEDILPQRVRLYKATKAKNERLTTKKGYYPDLSGAFTITKYDLGDVKEEDGD